MGILLSLRSYAKWFHRALHVHENDEIYILNLRHTMFNVHIDRVFHSNVLDW